MKKILSIFLGVLFLATSLIAQPINPPLEIAEEDGSPSAYPYKLKVTNGTLIDNADGTVSLAIGGGVGGEDLAATLAIGADANDLDITSLDKLEGFDAQVYIDLGTDGYIELEADTGILIGSAGVLVSEDGDGAITFKGQGNGADEDITLNLDDTADTGVFSSSTGLSLLDFGSISLEADSMQVHNVFNAGEDDDPADVYIHSGGGIYIYEASDDFVASVVCKDGAAEFQFNDDVNIGANGAAENLIVWGTITGRLTPRITTIVSNANPTINTDNCDAVTITVLATDIASMTTNLSGTPNNFDKLIIRFKDDGTARAITWGASFEAKGVALPTTTVISKVLTVGLIYDSVTSKWGCVASAQES